MFGYVVSQSVVLRSAAQVKHIASCEDFQKVGVDRIQINALNEYQMARDSLSQQFPNSSLESLIRTVPYERLATWDRFPMLLGRRGKNVSYEGNVLREQMLALRASHPRRQRFRVLIANGFGTNLGDTLIGSTAFRVAWEEMTAHLPQISIDVLTGWSAIPGVTRLLHQLDGVEQVLKQGPTLLGLGRYQALFDFSNLITLPRYGTMPPVDWYLWWLGLDPAQTVESDKRNRIALDPEDAQVVAKRLAATPGPKILINPKASEPLRRMPDSTLQAMAEAVLAADPAARVVFDQTVSFAHPRAIHLADVINSPQRLVALVAQVQGIITPDTFVQHVADATGTPTCTLNTSVPAGFFRYYPTVQTMVVSGAEALGGWGKTKVPAEKWDELAPAYTQAWSRTDPEVVLAALRTAGRARAAMPDRQAVRIDKSRKPFEQNLVKPGGFPGAGLEPVGRQSDAMSDALGRQLLRVGAQLVLPGDTVAMLGAGAGDISSALAKKIAPHGRLIVCDPRRMVHQLICANLLAAGLDHVETHPAMPTGSDFSIRPLGVLALQDDHCALDGANLTVTEPVVHWPLDRLELPQCRLLILQPPVPLTDALRGAAATVARHRPFVLAGLLTPEEPKVWAEVLPKEDYVVRVFALREIDAQLRAVPQGKHSRTLILVAKPRNKTPNDRRS